MTIEHAEIDQAVRTLCEARDYDGAATRALSVYSAEVLSFLTSRLRSSSDAEEAFALFAEDLWKGLPGFAFRCSVRGWLYTLARNAGNRWKTAPHNRRERNLGLSGNVSLPGLIAQARSRTHVHQRTEVKERVRALRKQLSIEDQSILILHVDRGLPWRELAMVMHDDGETLEGEALDREAARLRKRFERVKLELRELAIQAGLLQR